MKKRTASAVLMVIVLSTILANTVQGHPSWATHHGNHCIRCHGNSFRDFPTASLTGKMQVSDTGIITDLGTQLDGKVRGPLKTFRVIPGDVITLSVDVLDGYDKFAVQLKDFEKGGQANNQANTLIWSVSNSIDNVWTRQEYQYASTPPYFTKDAGNDYGIFGNITPTTYTFDLLVEAATPPDFYELQFTVAGTTYTNEKNLWVQKESFYLEVVLPSNPAVVRGGAMYDKWWAAAGIAPPATDNPLWASRPDTTSNTRTGADTWRCKECHGWDYKGIEGAYAAGSHRTGIAGIFGTTRTVQEIFDLLKTYHGYGTAGLTDEDIWDLAAFVTEGLIDTDSIIDANGIIIGDAATGKILYETGIGTNINCAECHGRLGLTPPPGHPDFDAYVGYLSNNNPREFQHKVRFGHPGSAMPGSVAGGGTILNVADLGAYSQRLPQTPPNPAVVRGGAMYDKWWAVKGLAIPTSDHPLWASRPDTTSNTRTGADTWRCKECHGWDYKGVDGAYADGSHRTGIAGIFGTTKTTQEVFELLKNNHAYGTTGLTDEDISDMAAFITEGLIDTDSIIDIDGVFTGDAALGNKLYDFGIGTNINCAACHGQFGLTPPPGDSGSEDFIGLLSNMNPWEFQHKVQFGHPGSVMPSSIAGGGTILDVADLGAYSQTLPQAPIVDTLILRGGAMYDKWWVVVGAAEPTTDHPLWASRPDTTSNTRTGAETWRCNECHGWDYKGVDGAYADGSNRTGIKGIFGTTKTVFEIFDLLKIDHGYGTAGLTDSDIWDLIIFVSTGMIDTDSIIDADGLFTGNEIKGKKLYDFGIGTNINCAACHGQLGLASPTGNPDYDDYVGLVSNKNPWEFQHKVQFGHAGSGMPGSAAGGTILDLADVGAYSQTLPQEPAR